MFYTLIAYRPTGDDTYGSITHSACFVAVVADEAALIEEIATWEVQDFIDDELATFEYTVVRPNGFIDDIGQWKHAIKAEADARILKIKQARELEKLKKNQAKEATQREKDLAQLAALQTKYGVQK